MSTAKIIIIWSLIVVFASSASIITRFCKIPASDIGFWRVFIASILLLPLAFKEKKKNPNSKFFTIGSAITGFFLGIHFASWCWAIQHCSIANATLFIGLQPLMVPFIAYWLIKEKLNPWEIVGVALAVAGTIWIGLKQFNTDAGQIKGSAAALGSALLCSTYIVMGRKFRKGENAIVFSCGVFLSAAAVQALISILLHGNIKLGSGSTIIALLSLGLFPTIGGHALMLFLLKYAKSQTISFTIPTQFLLASFAAVPIFGEIPPIWFYPGAALIITGVIIGIIKTDHSSEINS